MKDRRKKELTRGYDDVKPEEVLALDVATVTGYYNIVDGGGVWDFDKHKGCNSRFEYASFRETLVRYIKANNIKQIVAEDVNVGKFFASMRKMSEFRGILREVCESLWLNEPIFVPVKANKKCLTGDGNASKKKMMRAVKQKFGIDPIDDNHADAIGVYYYYIKNPNKR